MIGELLGDGSITFPGKRGNKARFIITMGINNYPYLLHLRYNIYKDLCTDTKLIFYPNPDKTGKPVQQYWFGTKSLLALTHLHNIWYINKQSGKSQYTKIVPININEMLKPIGLAHWIIGNGYWNTTDRTVNLCTDNFTEKK
uniref:LAGLIDADG endonuclease n=1 Tax=Parasitella parasitica TaxID=35722 RepID=A0A088S6Y6_9FUNG|nr:LAGLIDADG endonuclease [Parasitella parasitica]AIO05759.1 LAGLIDADG endonuclease [Parasitella parasitica]